VRGPLAPARAISDWSFDVDSFVSMAMPSRAPGSVTNQRGYHPILAIRAGTGEVLHVRLRTGSANTLRGIGRFCDELIARVGRAGASGPKLLRANPGFWNKQTFTKLDQAGWQFSIGVRLQPHVRAAIEQTRSSSRASRSAFRVGYGATCRPRSSSSGCR
jgi:hypothetical protein